MMNQDLFILPPKVEARWLNTENITCEKGAGGQAMGGRKGAMCYGQLKAGQQTELGNYHGSTGVIRHIWTTVDVRTPKVLRGLRMDFYWDGADKPAISVPYGDFFGSGLGEMPQYECAFFNNPEGRNYNSFIPMPFRTGFRITVTNESDTDLGMFWFQADITIHDELPPNTMYLHAHFNRENPTKQRQDYEFLPLVAGSGRYLGVNFGVIVDTAMYFKSWWGEGEAKIFIDGDGKFPTLCGTGTEDYIMTSWGQGKYANAYAGCHVADSEKMRFCFYRYHIPDPIYFRKDIRCTIQQLGCYDLIDKQRMKESGNAYYAAHVPGVKMDFVNDYMFERADDWSSCAYFYLDKPTNNLPPLIPIAQRLAGLA